MSYLNRVDAEHVARMYAFQQLVKSFSSENADEHVNRIEKEIAGKTIKEKKWIANSLTEMQLVEKNRPLSDDENVLVKAVNVLTVLGYTDLAKELGALADRVGRCVTLSDVYMNHIIDGAVKKNRSDAASGHRHHLHDEILAIIKATWEKNPALSKKKMIAKLMSRYEGRVDEGTVDSWIKKEKLLPPKPKKYIMSELVVPDPYT
ncbi:MULTISPECIES: hypothetical protein [Enterobacteriaceae]|mgnify:CR=1 FL=1|uniref:hypothetical protein n=1 Tax=Enterobacteriaceae TaxID=543 RepID=UPI0007502200|nr:MULTISPECIES: hypothetical protein [Enterobacteriaceae]HBQ3102202.1 hypothetical protein [Klebsiella quasipneumoniae subsp. similipneumoniae]HCA9924535.1 hypothetical protein [Klebsiella variicola subsp. variicola]HCA9957310.1 hypothetical protein [Klebsiella quasipneumoniae subsp. quasipneumoniae]EKW9877181.1 hypothetical protein [Klebsiella pneumoniae]EKY0527044.1 hypothetical protein [Klebsiella pneumoniae]